ncbi:DEAD/DEAH box helicase [Streptomyces sp. NPDC017979]|uniref:DEAD/DEAH box helicase n=1 Tax=Streptomyces sp. NPDC017979 TaxID=3365024 RepID=UPI0037B8BFD7
MDERKLHGLFIGIDNYTSPDIRPLNFAKRDARVLHALFLDNFEGKASLLLDAEATKARLLTEMGQLAKQSSDDDIVVISFSGHGTASHELATSDTDRDDPTSTAVHLEAFVEQLNDIRASILLVILDCCFAGGAVAKVLQRPASDGVARSLTKPVAQLLKQVSGRGRVVLAAATKDQEAYERPPLRHGLLTYHVLAGLLGDPEVVVNGDRVPLLRLADVVSRRVSSDRSRPFQLQNAVVASHVDGGELPVLTPGAGFERAGGGPAIPPATHAFPSLAPFGVPDSAIALWQDEFTRLNSLQVAAVNDGGLLTDVNVLVSAPTSSGKTLVGELAALRAYAQGRRTVILLPTRALVNEQYERLVQRYAVGGAKVIRATGELRDHLPALFSGKYDLAVLTYEKYIGLLFVQPRLLRHAGMLVVDEIQSLFVSGRGPLLEILFTWLKMRRSHEDTPQIVGLSAVLGGAQALATWLGARPVTSVERAVPLYEGVIDATGRFRYVDHQGVEGFEQLFSPTDLTPAAEDEAEDDVEVIRVVQALVGRGHRVLVFRNTRALARTLALKLATTLGLPPVDGACAALDERESSRSVDALRACLVGGTAFHTSDLDDEERRLVEQTFRARDDGLHVVVATTTLAQGVNLPADSVVITELLHPGGERYKVSEYRNMAGRAGRTGLAGHGRSVIVTHGSLEVDRLWQMYVTAEPEAHASTLLSPDVDARSVVLAAFAGPGGGHGPTTVADVERFLSFTLAAYQRRMSGQPDAFPAGFIPNAIDRLLAAGLLKAVGAGHALTGLGEIAVKSGLSVDSVTQLAEVLAAVAPDAMNQMTLIGTAQLVKELDDTRFVRMNTHSTKANTHLVQCLTQQKIADPVLKQLMDAQDRSGSGAGRARRALASQLWAYGMSTSAIERSITHPLRGSVSMPVRQAARRTTDVIQTVIDVLREVSPENEPLDLAERLPVALELGIRTAFVPVAVHLPISPDRRWFSRLFDSEVRTASAIAQAEEEVLLACVGGDAENAAILRTAAVAAQTEEEQMSAAHLPAPVD